MLSRSFETTIATDIFCNFRRDSTIVAPYERWEYYDPRVIQIQQDRNYALNKTKKVAWFVSNCGARNGRLQFAHELQKHIQVRMGRVLLNLREI